MFLLIRILFIIILFINGVFLTENKWSCGDNEFVEFITKWFIRDVCPLDQSS